VNNNNLLGALRGPVLLVTLGVLNLLSLQPPRVPFRYTWPVLVIVYGTMKLGEALLNKSGEAAQG
jgi:hypothetical protein